MVAYIYVSIYMQLHVDKVGKEVASFIAIHKKVVAGGPVSPRHTHNRQKN